MSSGATVEYPAPEWMLLENLLLLANKLECVKLPTVESGRVEHANKVLQSKLGCDLLLNSHGILFPIHSAWALGGPNADWMLKCLFQGTPEHPCEIPFPGFSPIVVDRFVNFLYLRTYQRNIEMEVSNIAHAENKPDVSYSDFTRDMKSVRFDLEVIKFGEFLEYPDLIQAAYAKMVEQLLMRGRFTPRAMRDFVEWTHGTDKVCKDEQGLVKQLIVGAVIMHMDRSWGDSQLNEFLSLVEHHPRFLSGVMAAKELHKKKLLESSQKLEKKRRKDVKRKRITSG